MRCDVRLAACAGFLVAAMGLATAGDDEKPGDGSFRLPLTAPAEDVKAAIAERAVYDGIEAVFPPEEKAVVLRRPGAPFEERDSIIEQLRDLDAALALRARLRALTEAELVTRFESACPVPPGSTYRGLEERDAILLEIVRRGGDAWRDRLSALFKRLDEWRALVTKDGDTRSWDARDLELLTALRRLEGKPDPVRMEVTAPEPSTYPDLPEVALRMVNGDERTVTMTRGGNYRSGREERYHVEARDAKGRILPSLAWRGGGMGGGMYSRDRIATDKGLGTALPLGRYVAELPSGEYSFRIHYSDWGEIASPDGFLRGVVVSSAPFKVRVQRRVIETTVADQARFAALAEALPTKGPVQLLEGEYGPWAHGFVASDSAAGKLLAAGWPVVPALARFAARTDADPMRRAWALAVLYGVTGRLDPSALNVIGDHETHTEGYSGVTGGGFSRGSTKVTSAGRPTISAAAQDEFARAWAKIAACVELRVAK